MLFSIGNAFSLPRRCCFFHCFFLWVIMVGGASPAQEGSPPDSLDADYASQLPRSKPLEPSDALTSFQVAPGFRIELAAAEPLVVDPVAMAFDERGRLYVIEMRDYSEDDELRLGRVRLLLDTNNDGRFDDSHIFADDLAWPTAITCYDGGVFVGAAPDILYFKDSNGDHHADVKQTVFTGFGRSNVQGLVNSFHWGLDNRIHGATSSSGADVVPGNSSADAKPVALHGRDFAFDPRTLAIEPTSGGAQHGMSFNAWGDKFVCSNSDHIQQVMFEDRYAARNPYAVAPPPRRSIAVDGPQADVFRTSPVEPWRTLRTRLRMKGIVPGPVEGGGRAAGYFTSATGVTIYLGDAWPAEYSGWAMIGDVGGNLIHRKRFETHGIHLSAHRVDENTEFVSSSDIWFRPVQFANAPDGNLYVLDMYREVIEHPDSLHPVIKQHLDLTSGRDRGRIYRVVAEGSERRGFTTLDQLPTKDLAGLVAHPNGWHRETAARLLVERGATSVVRDVEQVAGSADLPEGRLRALYVLNSLHALDPSVLLSALGDSHAQVRRHAIRLAESETLRENAAIRNQLHQMATDNDAQVRYQLAFTLGFFDGPARDRALAQLASSDGHDPYFLFALQSSLVEGAGNVLALLAQRPEDRQSAGGQALMMALAAQIGRQQRSDDIAAVLRVLHEVDDGAFAQQLVAALAPKADSELASQLAEASGGRSSELLEGLLHEARANAENNHLDVAARVVAVERLQLARFEEESARLSSLLAPHQPAELQQATLKTLSRFPDDQVASVLLAAWPTLTPSLRSRAGDVLLSRASWTDALLDALEQGSVVAGDISPGHWQSLATHPDAELRDRAQRVSSSLRSSRQEVLEQYQAALSTAGDVERGRKVFQKTCATCHQVEGQGFAIGPNLATMRNRGPEAILSNVLMPNAEVNPQFINYTVITSDGRSLSGMIADESAASVTLQRAENARDTILRLDIEEMRSTGMSLMPEGVEKDIDVSAMADLLAYLMSVE